MHALPGQNSINTVNSLLNPADPLFTGKFETPLAQRIVVFRLHPHQTRPAVHRGADKRVEIVLAIRVDGTKARAKIPHHQRRAVSLKHRTLERSQEVAFFEDFSVLTGVEPVLNTSMIPARWFRSDEGESARTPPRPCRLVVASGKRPTSGGKFRVKHRAVG